MSVTPTPERDIITMMEAMGFTIDRCHSDITPLTGGVSADIWRVETSDGPVVVKRALAQLRVHEEWHVSIARNQYEVAWLETVAGIAPEAVPHILAADAEAGLFVMDYLPAKTHPVWKTELAAGNIDEKFAVQVAELLALIHSKTANKPELAEKFDTDALFHALRPAPYFIAAGEKNPDVLCRLEQLTGQLFEHKKALVHGDISPKTILHGPRGPVLLDAECAWYGDPAFDLAFCLNHLLLKTLWQPQWTHQFMGCFEIMYSAYLARVDWEAAADIEQRIAHLLPALLLGRIDGKSPVEYITEKQTRNRVREFAKQLLLQPTSQLSQLQACWSEKLGNSRQN